MSATAIAAPARPEAPQRRGWCPGALMPMETGDGLLARVRPRRGRLTLDQAAALADGGLVCGNGAIGLSGRGNLHLRGLSERALPDLHARLDGAGLLDADPEVERLRNIVASPLDDIDPEAAFDLASAAASLEARLAADESLRALPAKFGFVLDALGRLPLADVDADIRFEALPGGRFAIYLAGDDALSTECARAETGEVAARLGRAFLRLSATSEPAPARMRALVARVGVSALFAEAGLDARHRRRSERRASLRDALGSQSYGDRFVVGAAAAFGEIEAIRFRRLVERAREAGASGLRLTPWRAFLIAGLDAGAAASMLRAVETHGFLASADEPRLRIAACPGAPACLQGRASVREDAERWAPMLPKGAGVILHVSGCAKGCARAAATTATLTATEAGYDLILGGKAGDPPVQRGLSREAVAALLASEGAAVFAGAGLIA